MLSESLAIATSAATSTCALNKAMVGMNKLEYNFGIPDVVPGFGVCFSQIDLT